MSIDATRATWKLSTQVTAIQKLLLLSLADRAGEDGECWPSLKRLEADTNLNRKTLIDNRKKLIALGLIELTGEMKGKKKQIPVMRLTYINQREQEPTSPENGSRTSTENGTRTSTENGTLNLKEESKKRIITESVDSPATSFEDFVQQVVDTYHEKLPEMPTLKIITDEVKRAVKVLIKEWPKIKGKKLTIDAIALYFQGRRELTSWILRPYQTKDGNFKRSRLINIIRIDNVRKFYNGEYTNG